MFFSENEKTNEKATTKLVINKVDINLQKELSIVSNKKNYMTGHPI